MADEANGYPMDATSVHDDGNARRDRSSIEFPYLPLDVGIGVAAALHSRTGFTACQREELAAVMGMDVSSTRFKQSASAARTFGLIEKHGRSYFILTDLGKRAVDDATKREARVEAFLHVPLYRKVFEKFHGHRLPPREALEREIQVLGVAPRQTDKARQALFRSAQQAGFFDRDGAEWLVRPQTGDGEASVVESHRLEPESDGNPIESNDSGRAQSEFAAKNAIIDKANRDPIIEGLLARLPEPGKEWPEDERNLWLGLLKDSFRLIYKPAPEERAKANTAPHSGAPSDNSDERGDE